MLSQLKKRFVLENSSVRVLTSVINRDASSGRPEGLSLNTVSLSIDIFLFCVEYRSYFVRIWNFRKSDILHTQPSSVCNKHKPIRESHSFESTTVSYLIGDYRSSAGRYYILRTVRNPTISSALHAHEFIVSALLVLLFIVGECECLPFSLFGRDRNH